MTLQHLMKPSLLNKFPKLKAYDKNSDAEESRNDEDK